MDDNKSNLIVEVSVDDAKGRRAVGIMNMRQALDLPRGMARLSYSHPDPVKAAAGIVISRQELESFLTYH